MLWFSNTVSLVTPPSTLVFSWVYAFLVHRSFHFSEAPVLFSLLTNTQVLLTCIAPGLSTDDLGDRFE